MDMFLYISVLLFAATWTMSLAGSDDIIRFHSADRKAILNMHNDLRRSIYNAANMRELKWNHAVAHAAAEWGSKCDYVSRPDNLWGQNMNYFHGTEAQRTPLELFRDSFKGWANETMHYDYRRFKHCGKKNVCSYAQLIAADVEQVGCAVMRCPHLKLREPEGLQDHAKLLICFYTPWVDIRNEEVFIPHSRCSACPPGTACFNNLCSARFVSEVDSPSRSTSGGSIPLRAEVRIQEGQAREEPRRERQRGQGRRRGRGRGRGRDRPAAPLSENLLTTSPVPTQLPEGGQKIIYVPNNRVVPFPGKAEINEVRQLRKDERYLARLERKELHQKPESVGTVDSVNKTVRATHAESASYRVKRQAGSNDPRYIRRLEEDRRRRYWEQERERRAELRRRHQAELIRRQREDQRRRQRELADSQRQDSERQRRAQALQRLRSAGELSSTEQYFTISAHNLLRREDGARDLTWSSHLERWARYVIRCDTEYPGPITCYTNFGKTDPGQEIYNVVYGWGSEGKDVNSPIREGCRTPYDRSRCNHNTIIRDPNLTQMGCAAMDCGSRRQLTCIYNSG